jgi:hypothetical protein
VNEGPCKKNESILSFSDMELISRNNGVTLELENFDRFDTSTSEPSSPRSIVGSSSDEFMEDMDPDQDHSTTSLNEYPCHDFLLPDENIDLEQELVMHNWQLLRSMSVPSQTPPIPAGRAHACFQLQARSLWTETTVGACH